jgi:hypothetical protein
VVQRRRKTAVARAQCESGGEREGAGERWEELWWWPGVLRGLYRGRGRVGKAGTCGNG